MADPLSIAASIIAVIGAAESVGKTLTKIRNIRNTPSEVLALINEISDLRVILGDFEGYIAQNTASPQLLEKQLNHMSILLQRAKDRLLELDQLVEYRLLTPESRSDQIRVSRRKWARSQDTVKRFRRSLRDIRLNIVAQMVVVNSSYQSRIGLTIDDIYIISSQLQATQSFANDRAMQCLDEHSSLLSNILHGQGELQSLLHLRTLPDDQSLVRLHEMPSPFISGYSSNSLISIRAHIPTTKWYSCPSYCRCNCHQERHFTSPPLLHKSLGMLFLGYSGYPLNTLQRCTEIGCQTRGALKMSIRYLFPAWFLTRVLTLSLINTSCNEIQASLKTRRVVPTGAEVFDLVRLDDVDGLKSLFSRGLATPNDMMYNSGHNPLYLALIHGHVNACKFLLDAGADPYLGVTSCGWSAFDYAWTYILQASGDKGFLKALRSLFPITDDYLEERQLSKLHKIVLGITSHDLKAELAISRLDIDRRDSLGFTPLMWAARKDDHVAVKFLLKAKANLNIHNSNGSSALTLAARSSLTSVKLLLEAGADPFHSDNGGFNALHIAAEDQDSKEMIECLVAAGVNLHGRNIYGAMPISQAAIGNNALSAKALLDYGADIDSRNNNGVTPLHASFRWHSDDMIQLLLNHGANHTLLHNCGGSILHLAARSGGSRTLDILQAAHLKDLNPDLTNREGKTPLQLAQDRITKEEGFVQTFQTLLYKIRIQNAAEARSSRTTSDTAAEDRFTNVVEGPSQTLIPNSSGTASSEFSRWARLSSTDWIIRKLGLFRARGWFAGLQNRFAQSRWMAFMIYWILGLGWAGFFYMIFFSERGGSGEKGKE